MKVTMNWSEPITALGRELLPHGKGVLLAQTGSRAYGTNRPDSDFDFRGVYVASAKDLLKIRDKPAQTVDIAAPDITAYELEHFARLAADANPGVLEILFAPRFVSTEEGAVLRKNRHLFMSKKIYQKYGGYARAQMNKAADGTGGSRGTDHYKRLKFKLHTLRLLDAGIAGLTTGQIQVKHPDPELLWKMAALDVSALQPFVDQKIKVMEKAWVDSDLPDVPNYDKINELVYELRNPSW